MHHWDGPPPHVGRRRPTNQLRWDYPRCGWAGVGAGWPRWWGSTCGCVCGQVVVGRCASWVWVTISCGRRAPPPSAGCNAVHVELSEALRVLVVEFALNLSPLRSNAARHARPCLTLETRPASEPSYSVCLARPLWGLLCRNRTCSPAAATALGNPIIIDLDDTGYRQWRSMGMSNHHVQRAKSESSLSADASEHTHHRLTATSRATCIAGGTDAACAANLSLTWSLWKQLHRRRMQYLPRLPSEGPRSRCGQNLCMFRAIKTLLH